MLTQSKEVQNAWRASQRTLDIKVTIDGKTYGATDVNSLKYDSGAYSGDTFAIGSTYSNTVQIEFSHLIEGLKLGMEVRPSIGIKTSSGYVYEPLGVFIISSEIKMDRNNNLTTVSASDRFCGLEGTYVSKLTYPAKVLDVIAEICAQSGVKANADDLARLPHQADLSAPITGQSYRKALGWIAQLYVGYALFDRQGLFTIRTISEPNYELDPSQYEQAGLTKNEAAYKINGIQCQVTFTTKTRDGESTEETKTYQAGDATGSQIKLENNIMTPQRLNDIWEQLKDLTFYPFSLNWFGNPAVEAGDWLQLEDKQGNSFVVPNSSYTLDFNGGLSATSKADQTTSSDQMVPWQGSVAQTIKELRLRRVPDGTVVFPPSVTAPPTNAKFNDVWFKKNGNSTELWIFEKQDDGSGKWIRKDLSDDEIKKKVTEAQQGLNQAKADIINNKQKADADIENLNKSIETNKKVADESLQKLNDSVTNLQGQYDNNVIPNLNKVMADASDALQKYISAQNSIADLTKQAQQQGKDIADVSNTVKGLNINYANLAGDVNSTKVDVKGLQTTVGTANGDIAQLKLNAQNLQTMLAGKVDHSTYTNFVNLTNQALNARLTASDLSGYAKTTDVQATANGLKMNIDSVSGKLNNLRIGGKNLLYNSAGPFQPKSDGRIDNYQWFNSVTINMIQGQQYTVSGITNGIFSDYHDPSTESDRCVLWLCNYDRGVNQIISSNTTDHGTTFIWNHPTDMYTLRVNTYHPAEKNQIKAWNIKIESGNKKTDWTPAPEDVANDITQLSARITANSQQFSSYYTKMETDTKADTAKNDAVNAIRSDSNWQGLSNILTNSGFLQAADGFLQKVQQTTIPMFNGGGVNLLHNSVGPFRPIQTINTTAVADNFAVYNNSTIDLIQGENYTISGETNGAWSNIHNPNTISDKCVLWLTNETAISEIVSSDAMPHTFTWNHPSGTYKLRVNAYHHGADNPIYAEKVKIERGSAATPWSPNPADLVTKIAFSELNQTVNGLRFTVSNNHGELQSQISQTAKNIRQEVSDKTNGLQTQINQQANNFNVSLNSLRKETAWQKVTSAIDANNYKTTGNYWIQAAPNSNTPDSSAWAYLQVVAYPDVERIKQTWQRDNNENEIYTRLLIGDNWTGWQRTVTGGNIMAQINMSAGTTLIQNDKIYMDASSTVFSGNAFIPSAAITSLTADKITAGTINGAKVNVINLNANNITAGTLKGSNGEFYLDSGALHVWQNNHDAWIDQNGIHDYDNQRSVWIQKGEINFEHQLGGSMKHTGVILTNSENSNLNGAITIKGDEGFLLSTKNFTTNYWSEQGFSWGTNTAHYVSGSGILGFNNNITVSAGSTDDHSIAALIAGAIPSKNLGNVFGARAQPGVYIYGRNDSNKDHSFVDIKAPASIYLTTLDSYITIGDTTGSERNSDVSINSGNYLTVSADNSISITACSKTKADLMPRISLSEASTSISGDSITLNAKNYVTLLGSSVSVTGDFGVLGKKNAIVPTSRGMAAINAYETAEYYFGDIGETQTNSNGVVTVMIDPYFLETVNTLVPYQVFLTPYGNGNVWVSSRSANNFTVKSSNPNIHFAWEIKAKRKGYENDRMKIVKGVFNNEQY